MKSLEQFIKESLQEAPEYPDYIVTKDYGRLVRIDEARVNNILRHGKHGFIIISANRSEIDPESSVGRKNSDNCLEDEYVKFLAGREDTDFLSKEFLKKRNKACDKELLKRIQEAGYAYTPVFGGYRGTDDVVDSYEPSYIVYNHKRMKAVEYGDFDDLFKLGVKWCGEFKQDSFYCQRPGEPAVWVNKYGEKLDGKATKLKLNRDNEEYFTTVKRKQNCPQRFTSVFESLEIDRMYVYRNASCYGSRFQRSFKGEIFV